MEYANSSSSIHDSVALNGASPTVKPDAQHPLRVAIVGAGKMGANHARAIANCSVPARVVAIADASETALDLLGAVAPSAKRFGSLTELLSSERIDVAHICTPPASHGSLAVEALKAGCNVYVEKPFAQSTAEAEQIMSVAGTRGVSVPPLTNGLVSRETWPCSRLRREG